MFDLYDTVDKVYELTRPDGSVDMLTEQDVHDFVLFCLDSATSWSFEKIMSELKRGNVVTESYYEFDWTLGTNIFKGVVKFKKIKNDIPPKITTDNSCRHNGKYVNSAGGARFWVCPTCKKDLGDA